MVLFIKNMVCDRCIMSVIQQLQETGLPYRRIQLGEVELDREPSPEQLALLRQKLEQQGFELLDDKKARLVEKIKNTIVGLVHSNDTEDQSFKLSAILQERLGLEYHYLSNLFSSVEGVTIERYAILQRIERVKELLRYDEKSLSDIAFEMGYSSVQHLSQQFKKITGLTPTAFKELKQNLRKPLDKV